MSPRTLAHAALLAACTIHAAIGQPVGAGGGAPDGPGDAAGARAVAVREDAGIAPEERAARRALAEAAREVVAVLQLRVDAGEAMTPALVELFCQSYRRLYLAEQLAADDRAGRDKALAEYLERMRKLYDVVDQRFKAGLDASRVQVTQMNYFLREAELWLAESKRR